MSELREDGVTEMSVRDAHVFDCPTHTHTSLSHTPKLVEISWKVYLHDSENWKETNVLLF